jgi:hypothetical protein
MPNYSKDEEQELLDFVHNNKEEIVRQKKWHKENGENIKFVSDIVQWIKKKLIAIIGLGALLLVASWVTDKL